MTIKGTQQLYEAGTGLAEDGAVTVKVKLSATYSAFTVLPALLPFSYGDAMHFPNPHFMRRSGPHSNSIVCLSTMYMPICCSILLKDMHNYLATGAGVGFWGKNRTEGRVLYVGGDFNHNYGYSSILAPTALPKA